MKLGTLILASVALLVAAVSIPLLVVEASPVDATPALIEEVSASPSPTERVRTTKADSETVFTALIDGQKTEVTMEEYLPMVLAAEMPASFYEEALKAQAVAARTYILYYIENGNSRHGDAVVCTDYTCCKAYASEADLRVKWGADYMAYMEKMREAVSETDGEYLVYGGEVIQAVFHSSSEGKTESGENVWNETPYLVSVDTPETTEDVPNFVVTVEVSVSDFQTTLSGSGAAFDGDPAAWLGETVRNASGRVQKITIGGVDFSGTQLRELFSLRSANFELLYDGEIFIFTVHGYGHGVGMSQYGANVMARNGADYQEILIHYYTGVEIAAPDEPEQ